MALPEAPQRFTPEGDIEMRITPFDLSKIVTASREKFASFRDFQARALTQYAGRFFGKASRDDKEGRKASPLNLAYGAVSTLIPNLVYNDPKCKVTTGTLAYRDYAEMIAMAIDYALLMLKYRENLRKVIFDALFVAGFMKTGISLSDRTVQVDGRRISVGQFYADRVDFSDMVFDPAARDWREQRLTGNRYRADADKMLEIGFGDPDLIRKLSTRSEEGPADRSAGDRLNGDRGEDQVRDILRYVDLVDLYIPEENQIVTMPYQKDMVQDAFINEAEYVGPDTGPYHMLAFSPVSENILPVAPAAIWFDLHVVGSRITRKLGRQAERLKRILAYEGSAIEDATEIAEADDGEAVRVDDISKIKEITFGGAAPESYAWMEWVKRNFSETAGNVEMMSGQSPSAPTLGQSEIMQANGSIRLGDMQNLVYDFTAEIAHDAGFYIHTDPLIELPLTRRASGQDTQVIYTPEMRKGEWLDYMVKIQPYSMARPDPNMSVRRKLEFATNVIPAAAQAMALLGPGFMVGAFLKRMALETGIEDADEWLNDPAIQAFVTARAQAVNAGTEGPGKAGGAAGPLPQASAGLPAVNPGQPNPSATGPTGGISTGTESASAQQETSGEIQGLAQPSMRSMAMSR
jgi:hypothetical protein